MTRKRLKPGLKRPVGRPPTAAQRIKDRNRLRSEREILREMGLEMVQVVVPTSLKAQLLVESNIRRLAALRQHALRSEDSKRAAEHAARLELTVAKAGDLARDKADELLSVVEEAARKRELDLVESRMAEQRGKLRSEDLEAALKLTVNSELRLDPTKRPAAERPVELPKPHWMIG